MPVKLLCVKSELEEYHEKGKIYKAIYNDELDLYEVVNEFGNKHYMPLDGLYWSFQIV